MKLNVIKRGNETSLSVGNLNDLSHPFMKEMPVVDHVQTSITNHYVSSTIPISCNENKEIKNDEKESNQTKDQENVANKSKETRSSYLSVPTHSKRIMLKFHRMFFLSEKENESQKSKENDKNKVENASGKSNILPKKQNTTENKRYPTLQTSSDKISRTVSDRFTLCSDGTHFHTLRRALREEKLRSVLYDLLNEDTKKERSYALENSSSSNHLSLINSWIDKIKSEKSSLHKKEKDLVNSNGSLVEKYGNCHEVIGKGAFGVVRISYKENPENARAEQLYAIKEFRRRPTESKKRYTKRLTSEFCISSTLRHPNVIHTLDLLKDSKGDYCEVMEFCAGGDLYSLILSSGKLDMIEADCYFKQLMRGVEYMHEMGVAHRDLKPENLLLTHNGVLKITDFGNGECFRMAWEKKAHLTYGLCGSIPYIAPEEYTDKEFDPRAVDVWATGVIYMAMRTGHHLWHIAKQDEDEFYTKYLQERKSKVGYEPIESLQRPYCRNVIYSILNPCPDRRITAKQVLRSEWGQQIILCKAGEIGL